MERQKGKKILKRRITLHVCTLSLSFDDVTTDASDVSGGDGGARGVLLWAFSSSAWRASRVLVVGASARRVRFWNDSGGTFV